MKMIDKKVDLRVTRTYKLLTMALLDLLCEKGQLFSNITINKICDKAMVHRTTFYKHFKDKFALLSSTLTWVLRDYLHMNVEDRLQQPLQSVSKMLFGNVLETIVHNQQKDEGFNNFFIHYIGEIFRQDFLELKRRGKQFSLPIELVAEFHSGVIRLLVMWWIQHFEENVTAEQMDEYYYLLVNENIMSE
ncbi:MULTISPECIES: TetR/AcrR family transcriptional regulator [Paenibacillus]|uniref:TetR/AcrR family transcriptional regulator n=1 Tax=Paenibacillus TaxID=44249 RepID=UPI00249BA450|nr:MULTISPECIES: TetR/AcrR family transcriptional regulator [Paenibacillus]WFA82767.1 TetR/AcrR family transcriptional regulator [Paenibacillus amylolyticus]